MRNDGISFSACFTEGLVPFFQPNGWFLSADRKPPQFFICVLTDINGDRHYCAVLSFSEAVAKEQLESGSASDAVDGDDPSRRGQHEQHDEECEPDMTITSGPLSLHGALSLPRHVVPGVSLPAIPHDALMFAPKCIALLSRHDDPGTLHNCLSVIYTAYSECLVGPGGERIKLETLVGNLLGSVNVPQPGGPQVRFSLGASDKILLQPPVHDSVPVTGTKVAVLFQQLGISNVLTLFCAAMTELKILLYSQSFNRLTDSCTALVALMYPMKYMHSLIPILPAAVGEMWGSPMPFMIGVHSSRLEEIVDLLDVVKVDLDGGSITVPENMTIHLVPEHIRAKVQSDLSSVLHPELTVADNAFPNLSSTGSVQLSSRKPVVLDKELRAIMLRLMTELLSGYRRCLTLVRIHPKPYITFHKAAFLGMRNLCDSEFGRRMLDCMFFNTFVSERGLPWRHCDIFDDLYSVYEDQCALERDDPSRTLIHIKMLAEELYRNENPLTTLNQPYAQRIPLPAEGAMTRVHQPVFPRLEEVIVEDLIRKGVQKSQLE
jgi:myotubularin-related protein 5/13